MEALFGDPRVDRLVEVLRLTPTWPADGPKDDAFARKMLLDYPSMDLCTEVERWQVWLTNHPEVLRSAKTNLRSRFVTWCRQGTSFGVQRREQGRGQGQRRARQGHAADRAQSGGSTRAGRPEEFGETGRLEHW